MIFSLEVRWLRKWGADHAQTWLGILDSHSAVIHVQWQSLQISSPHLAWEANVLFLPDTCSRTMSHCLFLPLTVWLQNVTAHQVRWGKRWPRRGGHLHLCTDRFCQRRWKEERGRQSSHGEANGSNGSQGDGNFACLYVLGCFRHF